MLLHNKFMYYALIQAKIGMKNNNIPIGCVITYKDKILSSKYNTKTEYNSFEHAELKTINEAKKKLNSKNLKDCKIYTTMEPCDICINIIKANRIKCLYFIIYNKHLFIYNFFKKYNKYLSKKAKRLLKLYFFTKRIKNSRQ